MTAVTGPAPCAGQIATNEQSRQWAPAIARFQLIERQVGYGRGCGVFRPQQHNPRHVFDGARNYSVYFVGNQFVNARLPRFSDPVYQRGWSAHLFRPADYVLLGSLFVGRHGVV